MLAVHPLSAAVASVHAALDAVADAQPMFVPTAAKTDLLRRLVAAEARLAELRLRVMASAGDVAESTGARDVAAWLAAELPVDRRAVTADLHLAEALDRAYPGVAVALAAGEVTLEQARVIVHALDEVAEDLSVDKVIEAERLMLDHAHDLDPARLRRIGRHLAAVVDPEAAEEAEARRLAAEEQHAQAKTRLSLKPFGDGTTRLSGILPDADAARLRTYLEAFAQPRVAALDADGKRVRADRLAGQAFCDLLEHIDPDTLPDHGGEATTLIVTLGLDQLQNELAAAGLLTGDRITADQARRLACSSKIIPAVLGGNSEILDLGRAKRLFTPAQRRAIRLRDKTCRAEGCDAPAAWTDIHHKDPWSQGGATDLDNGMSLCGHHHRRIHDHRYHHEYLPNGDVRYHRRT